MVYGGMGPGGPQRHRCALCGQRCGDLGLCPGCVDDLPFHGPACRRCALPLPAGDVCGACLAVPPSHDEAVAIFSYAPPVDVMIQRLKFDGNLAYARTLGKLMAFDLARRGVAQTCALIPVPLHPSRLVARRFNQAIELARPVAARFGMPLHRMACARIRATAEQSRLDAPARRRNVRNAFAMLRPVDGEDVVLLDDVMTTGSTLDALARAVKRAGKRRVTVWVCARATAAQR